MFRKLSWKDKTERIKHGNTRFIHFANNLPVQMASPLIAFDSADLCSAAAVWLAMY